MGVHLYPKQNSRTNLKFHSGVFNQQKYIISTKFKKDCKTLFIHGYGERIELNLSTKNATKLDFINITVG